MPQDKEALLALLEAHGNEFLKSFPISAVKRSREEEEEEQTQRHVKAKTSVMEDDGELDWTGFSSEEGDIESDRENDADVPKPEVIVFTEGRSTNSKQPLSRKFMSSKVSKLTKVAQDVVKKDGERDEEEEEEVTNARNDALLHQLVHTKLLSGSLNSELNLTSAQKKKALAGRVLELAGETRLGKGEVSVRDEEKKKAAKRVRDGMAAKQKERNKNALDEAKNLGNYHPTLKKLFEASSSGPPRKRERGMRMGIGKFSGGILKLSQDEISKVQDTPSRRGRRGGSGGRGRVGGRGGGGKKK